LSNAARGDGRFVVPASSFSFEQLANIYNQARVDYIVPMPMNGRRMEEYVRYHDIQLDGSFVAFNEDRLETGIAMLGVRGTRSWVTRLGVIPERRGNRLGQYLTEALIEESARRGIERIQLEVIVGNEPAYRLFIKLGFLPVRELLVIRRPPGAPEADPAQASVKVTEIADAHIPHYLERRHAVPSWIDESASLLNAGNLRGIRVQLPTGEETWVIFQRTPFQITRFAHGPVTSSEALRAALYYVHTEYAMQDAKIENVPVDSLEWPVYQSMGYFEVFRRIEMYLWPNR
jgi:ribosomal protein S18 acetylase RimI-like enzyme